MKKLFKAPEWMFLEDSLRASNLVFPKLKDSMFLWLQIPSEVQDSCLSGCGSMHNEFLGTLKSFSMEILILSKNMEYFG